MMELILAGAFCFGMLAMLYVMYILIARALVNLDKSNDDDWVP